MKLISTFVILILWTALAEAHPLHLSITNITYENGKLKVSMKTFRDDWEVAYFHYHSQEIDFSLEENRKIPWFEGYLNERFYLSEHKGAETEKWNIDTIKIEDEAMQIEMSGVFREKPNSLYIYNALLTDIFPDQSNLVIFEFEERETGIKFDVRKQEEVIELK